MASWAIWLIIAGLSAGLEVLSGDFFLLMLGDGCSWSCSAS